MLHINKSDFKRWNKPVLIFIVLLSVLCAGSYIKKIASPCRRLGCMAFYHQSKYKISDVYSDTQGTYRALYRFKNSTLRVDVQSVTSQSEATTKIGTIISQMKGLYENSPAPYPGDASREIACAKEVLPVFGSDSVGGINVAHFSGYLTSRLTYGACVEDLLENKAVMAIFYCPKSQQVVRLEWIASKKQFQSVLPPETTLIHSIRCI